MNQSVEHGKKTGINDYGEISVTVSTIKGRLENAFKKIRSSTGEEVVSSALLLTQNLITVGDTINGHNVITSEPKNSLNGKIEFYEVYLL